MNDRVAIVTGAAQGLGAGIVRALIHHGHRVVAADRSARVGELLQREIGADRAIAVQVDISTASAGDELVAAALAAFGDCDAVVNNAGVGGPDRAAADLSDDDLLETMGVNLLGAARLCRAAMPHLRRSDAGRVVNIGSVVAERPSAGDAAYAMSKAALDALTRSVAIEEGPSGVTANTVAPGYMLTAMHTTGAARRAARLGVTVDDTLAELRGEVPARRHGSVADVANAVRWLLSPEASYISGQTVRVDGGLSVT